MAFIIAPSLPFTVAVTMVDAGLDEFIRTRALKGADHTAALASAAAYVAELVDVTGCSVSHYDVSTRYINDTFVAPLTGVQKENQAIMAVRLTTSPLKQATVAIPGALDSIFVGGPGSDAYNVVDLTDSNLTAYMNQYLAAGSVYLSDGESMAASGIVAGKRRHVRSRRG